MSFKYWYCPSYSLSSWSIYTDVETSIQYRINLKTSDSNQPNDPNARLLYENPDGPELKRIGRCFNESGYLTDIGKEFFNIRSDRQIHMNQIKR
jgi:hypothetical protein